MLEHRDTEAQRFFSLRRSRPLCVLFQVLFLKER